MKPLKKVLQGLAFGVSLAGLIGPAHSGVIFDFNFSSSIGTVEGTIGFEATAGIDVEADSLFITAFPTFADFPALDGLDLTDFSPFRNTFTYTAQGIDTFNFLLTNTLVAADQDVFLRLFGSELGFNEMIGSFTTGSSGSTTIRCFRCVNITNVGAPSQVPSPEPLTLMVAGLLAFGIRKKMKATERR